MRAFLFPIALVAAAFCSAQMDIRVMQYNLLNFPEPNPPGKADTLAKILAHHPVDLLICEEIRTEAGANAVLTDALNTAGETRFSMAAWEPMHSDPGASYSLQQIIYYDHDKLGLKEQGYLLTYVRDINWYTLYLRTPDLAVTNDTTFLTVFAVHLKAGNSTSDANEREAMTGVLVDFLATLPPDRHVLVAGDMNLYSGFEGAMQTLVSTTNDIWLNDPVDQIGGWSGSSFYAGLHTQSTRVSAIYGDGSGGGLDDRFDLVLLSEGLMDANSPLHYQTGSYRALGNSGTCFNDNVTDCDSTLTPYAVLRSLFYMSDHLPVVLTLGFDPLLSVQAQEDAPRPTITVVDRGTGMELLLRDADVAGRLTVNDVLGREVIARDVSAGTRELRVPLTALTCGPWVASFASVHRRVVLKLTFVR